MHINKNQLVNICILFCIYLFFKYFCYTIVPSRYSTLLIYIYFKYGVYLFLHYYLIETEFILFNIRDFKRKVYILHLVNLKLLLLV